MFFLYLASNISLRGLPLEHTTVGRALKALGYRTLSAHPHHHAQDEPAIMDLKKLSDCRRDRQAKLLNRLGLSVRRDLPESRQGGRPRAAVLHHHGRDECAPGRDRLRLSLRRPIPSHSRQGRLLFHHIAWSRSTRYGNPRRISCHCCRGGKPAKPSGRHRSHSRQGPALADQLAEGAGPVVLINAWRRPRGLSSQSPRVYEDHGLLQGDLTRHEREI